MKKGQRCEKQGGYNKGAHKTRVRELMDENKTADGKKISYGYLAKNLDLGITSASLGQMCRGDDEKILPRDIAKKIADFFGVRVEYVLREDNIKTVTEYAKMKMSKRDFALNYDIAATHMLCMLESLGCVVENIIETDRDQDGRETRTNCVKITSEDGEYIGTFSLKEIMQIANSTYLHLILALKLFL